MHSSTLWRRTIVLVVVVLALAATPVASAQSVESGGSVTVPPDTTREGNLSTMGGTVVVEGTLDGSLDGLAGSVLITGTVTGDVEASAGSVRISGTVEGDVEVAAGSVTVGRDGRVGGSLRTGTGALTIDGIVEGDVEAGAETLTVGETATIGGNIQYDAETISIADGATVGGTVERVDDIAVDTSLPVVGPVDFEGPLFPPGLFTAFGLLVNAALGAVLLLAAPGFARRVTDTGTDEAPKSLGAGLLALVGIPVALLLLTVTIVGIPLAVAGFLLYLLVLWAAFVYGAIVSGTWLLDLGGYDSRWGALVVGLLVATVASLLPVGWIVTLAYMLVGLGAFALSALALRRTGGGGDMPGERAAPGGSETA